MKKLTKKQIIGRAVKLEGGRSILKMSDAEQFWKEIEKIQAEYTWCVENRFLDASELGISPAGFLLIGADKIADSKKFQKEMEKKYNQPD